MVILPQVEEEQGEDSVWRMFWRSDARISYRQIRRSATYLFMFLERQQSLKAFKTTQVLKPLISSHGRRHLKWCQHLSPRLPALRQVEEARDELAVQLREAKLDVIGLEGKQRKQKAGSSALSPVKEPVEGYESPFWKAFGGEAEENQGELGRNFGSAKAGRTTILVQDHEGVYSQMNETEKLHEVFQNTAGMLGENQPHTQW
jgi:hypothetical protein